jgi:hypothetical protein
MRAAAVAGVLLGTGLLAGHALADTVTVPVPSLPQVTVSVPSLPQVTVPTVAAAPLPAPATTAAPAATSATVPAASSVVRSTLGGPASSPSSSAAPSSSSGPSSDGPEPAKVERFRSSRSWIATTGPKRKRVTTLTFVLPHAARVVFVVKQVAPVCRVLGRFGVEGHRGVNRVRLPGRVIDLRLDPGTYRVSARTAAGTLIRRVTLVVVDRGAPSRGQLASARAANVCAAATRLATAAGTSSTGATNDSGATRSQPAAAGVNTHSGAVLGESVQKAARVIQPAVVALLALAILLLGLASMPRVADADSRMNDLFSRHRVEIAGVGAAAFVAVVLMFLVG